MKKTFKNESGLGFITVILILVIAVIAGGVTFLSIRMAITGEDFLAPIQEWFNSDDEEAEKKDNKNKNEEKTGIDAFVNKHLSSAAKKSGVKCYSTEDTSFEDILGDSYSYELVDIKGIEDFLEKSLFNVYIYATKDKVVEVVMAGEFDKTALKKMYKLNKDKIEKEGYNSYDEFEDYILEIFDNVSNSEENYYRDGCNFSMHMLEDEISMENFANQLDKDEEDVTVEDVIKICEKQFDVEIKEVK